MPQLLLLRFLHLRHLTRTLDSVYRLAPPGRLLGLPLILGHNVMNTPSLPPKVHQAIRFYHFPRQLQSHLHPILSGLRGLHKSQNLFLSLPLPPKKVRTHPKLRSVAAREPPVPPSLANKRSFWSLSLQRQASAESQQSDLSDTQTRGRKLSPGSVGFTEVDAYPVSDSEITVRRRQPSAHATCASGSRMNPSEETTNQNGLITCGGHTPEVPAAGAPASGPGPNGGHNKLDLRPGNPPDRGNIQRSSIGKVLRIVAGRLLNWYTLFLGFLRSWLGT